MKSKFIQYPQLEDYINALKSPQDNLNKLKRFRPFLNYDGSMDFWFNDNCVVFHMIDSLQDNYEFGLECCLKSDYFEGQRNYISSMPNNDIRIYENELKVTCFSSSEGLFPVILHRNYSYKECDKKSIHYISDDEKIYIFSKDKKILYGWNIPSGLIGKGLSILIVPDGVEEIAEGAFAGCEDIMEVYFPKSLRKIGRGAFVGCSCFGIHFSSKHLEFIDEYAFWGCQLNLNKFNGIECLPKTIHKVGENAFKDAIIKFNGKIHDIKLEKGNGVLNFRIYEKTSSLLSKQKISIDNILFQDDIEFDETLEDEDGVVYDKSYKYLIKCNNVNLHKYKIKDSTICICPYAFVGCTQLNDIDFSNVKYIGRCAFSGSGIKEVFLPKSVQYIGMSAFESCENLISVEILASIKKIEQNTFRNCKALNNVKLPNSIVSIERLAFGNCNSLEKLNLPNKLTKLGELAFCYCIFDEIILPKSLLHMDYSPFCGCRKTKMYSKSPLFFVNEQFLLGYNKTRLISYLGDEINLVVPGTVKVILGYSLVSKNTTQKIFLPDSVEYIGHWAFRNAKAKQINFPKSLTFVKSSFDYNSSIDTYIISEDATKYLKGSTKVSHNHIIKYNNRNVLIQDKKTE